MILPSLRRRLKTEEEEIDDLVEQIKLLNERIKVLEATIEMLKEANIKSKLPLA